MSMVATLNVYAFACRETRDTQFHTLDPRFHAKKLEFPSGVMMKLNANLDSGLTAQLDPRVNRPIS